jgi:hypothetical protein
VEDGVLRLGLEALLRRHQLVQVDAFERPPVRARHGRQFLLRLGERDVEDGLAAARAFEQEL